MKRNSQPPNSPANRETALLERIRELVLAARKTVARGVDLVQVHTCFQIGLNNVDHVQAEQVGELCPHSGRICP